MIWVQYSFALFKKNLDNGFKNVQFHIQGDLNDYTKEHIEHIVEVVADILECETQEIFVNGVKPSSSFFLVLSLKEVYTRKLSEVNEQDRLRLIKLYIDFIIVDLNTIFLQSLEGKSYFIYISYIFYRWFCLHLYLPNNWIWIMLLQMNIFVCKW